ncbi:oxidase like protein [Zymoseptoria brevis]|uniref:Oxidase like protein n=1 Tax=Zymoseptoria brevis TaxID=1047168 RepID=A0A0F4GEM1_9PEZI|nr:oxidase like protein [Zymoseptoria brevis]
MVGSKVLSAALLLNGVVAFPHIAEMVAKQQLEERQELGTIVPFPQYPGSPSHALYSDFDPSTQLVSTSGDHEFRVPGDGDIRGPCAGLNAAANHGYIPRSGIMTAEAINTGLWEAFSLDKTATIFLQTATMFFDGDPISGKWSIGRPPPNGLNSLGALGDVLGKSSGICGGAAHLKTEGDASITRGDYLAPTMNSNCRSYPQFAQELLDLAQKRENGNISPRVLAEHSYNRKQYSIANNPNYYSPAYAGVAFTFGAHMFAHVLLANHSAEQPRGFLEPAVWKAFFSYTDGPNGELIQTAGHERIPDNWYKRAPADAWTLSDIVTSTAQQCAAYPSNCQVGGNTGEVNSFSGVNLGDISGGLVNSATDLSDPARMGCFIRQMIQANTPSFLASTFSGAILDQMNRLVKTMLDPALDLLGNCPNLPAGKSVDTYDSKFPGAQNPAGGSAGRL